MFLPFTETTKGTLTLCANSTQCPPFLMPRGLLGCLWRSVATETIFLVVRRDGKETVKVANKNSGKSLRVVCLVVFGAFLCTTACVSRQEGERIKTNMQQLRREVAALQRKQHALANRNNQMTQQLHSTQTVTAGQDVERDRLVAGLQQLGGEVEQLRYELGQMQRQDGAFSQLASSSFAGLSSQEHLTQARRLRQAGDYEQAYKAYDALLARAGGDKTLLAQGLLGKAQTAFAWGQAGAKGHKTQHYQKAIRAYQEFLTRFSRHKNRPQVLYEVGQSLEGMGMVDDAKLFYLELQDKHGKTSFALLAKDRLTALEKRSCAKKAQQAGSAARR